MTLTEIIDWHREEAQRCRDRAPLRRERIVKSGELMRAKWHDDAADSLSRLRTSETVSELSR